MDCDPRTGPEFVPPTTVEDSSEGFQVKGWMNIHGFLKCTFAFVPGELRGSRDRVVNLAALKDNSRMVIFFAMVFLDRICSEFMRF